MPERRLEVNLPLEVRLQAKQAKTLFNMVLRLEHLLPKESQVILQGLLI